MVHCDYPPSRDFSFPLSGQCFSFGSSYLLPFWRPGSFGGVIRSCTANLRGSLIGIEACPEAHSIATAIRSRRHDVRLIPAQFVKPFLKSNKNDSLDAYAIGPGACSVPKSAPSNLNDSQSKRRLCCAAKTSRVANGVCDSCRGLLICELNVCRMIVRQVRCGLQLTVFIRLAVSANCCSRFYLDQVGVGREL